MSLKFSSGQIAKTAMVRLTPGMDIIEGVETVCRQLDITSGAISSCIGSLERASYCIAVPLDNGIGSGYGPPINLDGPLELLSAQGTIGTEQNEELFIHLHGVFSDLNGHIHGGHLIKGQSPVLITCEIMINQIQGVNMIRTYDPEVDMAVLEPFS